jgi:hypothetical protein
MPAGVKGNALPALSVPVLPTDEKMVIRGDATYRTSALDIPIFAAVANNGPVFRNATTNDPINGPWKLGFMMTDTVGNVLTWGTCIWIDELKRFFAAAQSDSSGANNVIWSYNGNDWWGSLFPGGYVVSSMAYAPSIDTIVCVATSGPTTTKRVITSTDGGLSWVERVLPTASVQLNGVVWSPPLSLFVAMGQSNAIFTSPDGVTWTSRTGPSTSHNWKHGVWADGAIDKFVLCSTDGGTSAHAYSSDGITWTNGSCAGGGLSGPDGTCYSPDLDQIIVTDGNGGQIAVSTNGTTFTIVGGLGSHPIFAVAWSHELALWLLMTSENANYTSPDGTTWTLRQPASFQRWTCVAASR